MSEVTVMEEYLLGIDNGGSMVKATLFSLDGKEIAVARADYVDTTRTDEGFTERDGEGVWRTNCEVIRRVLMKADVCGDAIIGIGVTGYGNGLHLVDENLKDVYPHIVSTDSRAREIVAELVKSGVSEDIYAENFQATWAAQPLVLIRWMQENNPEILARARYFVNIKDYIRLRLTGECFMEMTDASIDGITSIATGAPNEKIYELLGIEAYFKMMPEIKSSTDVCGFVTAPASEQTGLKKGTPVAGGMIDIEACAFGSGLLAADELAVVTGTWNMVEYLSPHPVDDRALFMNGFSYLPGQYMIIEGSSTSASNYDWLSTNVLEDWVCALGGREAFYEHTEDIMNRITPEETSCIFLPYLYASNTNPLSRGAFFNLNSFHTKEHIVRAVLEGVIFSANGQLEKLRKHNSNFKLIHMSGGITNSVRWTQMMSDVMQLPIEVVKGKEQGAKGAAMCAGIACGRFSSMHDASNRMTAVDKMYHPNPDRAEVYEKKFNEYREAAIAVGSFTDAVRAQRRRK